MLQAECLMANEYLHEAALLISRVYASMLDRDSSETFRLAGEIKRHVF